jgi:hypothetical protein
MYAMKRLMFGFLFPLVFAVSCGTPPEPVVSGGSSPSAVPAEPAVEAPVEAVFDPSKVTREVYDSTKTDVQQFISELNEIIRRRDYNAWVGHLGSAYLEEISSPEYLSRLSESAALRSQRIVLKSPRDYFDHVVVPSRSNSRVLDRVDDIEFKAENLVVAYALTPGGERRRLYGLEHEENGWKIVNLDKRD